MGYEFNLLVYWPAQLTPGYHVNISLRLTLQAKNGYYRSHYIYKSHDQRNAAMPLKLKYFFFWFTLLGNDLKGLYRTDFSLYRKLCIESTLILQVYRNDFRLYRNDFKRPGTVRINKVQFEARCSHNATIDAGLSLSLYWRAHNLG